jgi:hypothetical protein
MRGTSARRHDFHRDRSRNENMGPRLTDPSEQQIQRLCEEIQADWTESERQARQLWMPVNQTLVRPNQADLEYVTIPCVKVG